MGATLSIILVIILIAAYLWFRRLESGKDTSPEPKRPVSTASKNTEFHAVSIRFANSACDAAKAMKGRRFLSGVAPSIPLSECDVLECKCRFVHYDDRRTGEDRRNPYSGSIGGGTGEHEREQRKARERRTEPPDETF